MVKLDSNFDAVYLQTAMKAVGGRHWYWRYQVNVMLGSHTHTHQSQTSVTDIRLRPYFTTHEVPSHGHMTINMQTNKKSESDPFPMTSLAYRNLYLDED